jgi:hypothetical protein
MTTYEWEEADLDIDRPVATRAWSRPQSVDLEGDDLVFVWPRSTVRMAELATDAPPSRWREWLRVRRWLMTRGEDKVYPSRSMLIGFAKLKDASPAKVRLFASNFGALQESLREARKEPSLPLLPVRQPLGMWRDLAGEFTRGLHLAAKQERTDREDFELSSLVNRHLEEAQIELRLVWSRERGRGRGRPRVEYYTGGLYGGLTIELLSAVATVGLKLCRGCGSELQKGEKVYCPECRASGLPARTRQSELRERRKRERASAAFVAAEGSPGSAEGQVNRG